MQEQLKAELLKDPGVQLLKSEQWVLPVYEVEIEFETVKRSKMDVLMKMLLLSFQQLELSAAEDVSDILMVEPLFVEDLIQKMMLTGMIERKKDVFLITDKGESLLENGIFVHPPEQEKETAYYSPAHHRFFSSEGGESTETGSSSEKYRHLSAEKVDVSMLDESIVKEFLSSTLLPEEDGEEGSLQVEVERIAGVAEVQEINIPCYEFQLHHTGNERKYVRVWNTLINQWDETLEKQIFDKQVL